MSFTGLSRAAMPAMTTSSGQSSPKLSRKPRRSSLGVRGVKSMPL